ncbi:unnamed protein product [Paramecium octaurelia]|uniref:Uncharacterized protein n=1 Tax=Paramecium octaurelia TaxID=43137 RepID=A0A8S1UM67_PAROT|nr:unnamed protein product [Paramecium octaurelia]
MLKFLENRDLQPTKRGKDIMRYESSSHLPNNRQFNSPLHQDALIQNDKPTYYITKKLPPVQIYNPLVQTTDSVERPEYIVKQKDIYIPRYLNEYKTKGFKKKQGIFESYQHLLAQNKSLIQGIHTDKKPSSLPPIRIHKKEQSTLNIPAQISTRSYQNQQVDQRCFKSISQNIYSVNNRSIDSEQNKAKYITNTTQQKQRNSHKLLTENKGIQVNFEKDSSHKITEFSEDQTYNFNFQYQQKQEDQEEKERQMRELSIFDKKIKEFKEQQKLKLYKKEVS